MVENEFLKNNNNFENYGLEQGLSCYLDQNDLKQPFMISNSDILPNYKV